MTTRHAREPAITVEARIPLIATRTEHSKALVTKYNNEHPEETLHRLESSRYVDHYYSKGNATLSLLALMNPRVSVSIRARNWTDASMMGGFQVQITQITTNPSLSLPSGELVPFQTTQRDNLGGTPNVKEATAILRTHGYKPWFTLRGQNHKYHLYGMDTPEVTANFQNVTIHIGGKSYKEKFIDISVEDTVQAAVATLTRTVSMLGAERTDITSVPLPVIMLDGLARHEGMPNPTLLRMDLESKAKAAVREQPTDQ